MPKNSDTLASTTENNTCHCERSEANSLVPEIASQKINHSIIKRAVIFVNGTLADADAVNQRLRPDDWLVAADGGLNVMKSIGLHPHLLIGDLDSVNPSDVIELQSAGVEIRKYPVEKDETDLELALLVAASAGYKSIWLVAALGGRLDQTLANINLLLLPELADRDVRLFDGMEEVFLIRDKVTIHGQPGEIVSLIPLQWPVTGITTRGLKYPLKGETLYPERSRGISNCLQGKTARVQVESGGLLCIHTHKRPESPRN
jgi:thiamine pyrophosphokinase